MEYNREIVVDRIKSLIKDSKKAHKEGKTAPPHTQEALANVLGLSTTQVKNYLSKSSRGQNIPLDNLLKIADIYGCEIGYLLGEFDQPTRAAADITKETGLDPRAVSILTQKKSIPPFIDLINRIINDSYTHENKGAFPVGRIVGYMYQIAESKSAAKLPLYNEIGELLKSAEYVRYSEISDKYPDLIPSEYNKIRRALDFQDKGKRNMRIDIQDLFSDFLRSDFIENYEINKGD